MIFDVLVARYLRRNGLRSFVTAAAAALAVAIAVAVDSVNASASASFASGVRTTSNAVNLQVFGRHQHLDERLIAGIRTIVGVVRANPVVERQMDVREHGQIAETLNLVGIDMLEQLPRDAEIRDVRPGSLAPQGSEPSFDRLIVGGEAIVSTRVATAYKLHSSSSLAGQIGASRAVLRVAAILPPSVADIDSSVVFVDIGRALQIAGTAGFVDRIDCAVEPALLARVRERILRILPPGGRVAIPAQDDRLPSISTTFRRALIALSAMAFLVAGLLIYDGIATSAFQRQPEIVVLRNLGAKRVLIFRAFFVEGVMIGIVGAAQGLALSTFMIWSLVTGGLTFDVRAMFVAAIAGVGIATVSAILPAIDAAWGKASFSDSPHGAATKKMDHRLLYAGIVVAVGAVAASLWNFAGPGRDTSSITAILFVVATLLCVPAALRALAAFASGRASPAFPSVRFATTHLATVPRSAALIVAALVAAVAMLVTASIVVASYRAAVAAWTADTLPADLVIRPNDGLANGGDARFTSRDLARIKATAGIVAIQPLQTNAFDGQGAVAVTAGEGVDLIALRARVIASVAPTLVRVSGTRELRTQILAVFENTFGIAFGLCVVSLVIAIAGMANALAASVLERRLEIGLLRYLGLRRGSVERMILVEAGLIGILACAAGVVLGAVVSATVVSGAKLAGETPIGLVIPFAQIWPIAVSALFAILVAGIHPGHVASRIRTERVVAFD